MQEKDMGGGPVRRHGPDYGVSAVTQCMSEAGSDGSLRSPSAAHKKYACCRRRIQSTRQRDELKPKFKGDLKMFGGIQAES